MIHDILCSRVSSGHIAASAGSELSTIIALTPAVSYAAGATGAAAVTARATKRRSSSRPA